MNLLRWLLAAGLAANGVFMLAVPRDWYAAVPGAPFTGPLNSHFVRDIGCAYLVAAAGLGWRALDPVRGVAAAALSAAFLAMHGLVHVGETITGIGSTSALLRDTPGVIAPALLAIVLALPPSSHRRDAHAA